jgi:hypothetical protein
LKNKFGKEEGILASRILLNDLIHLRKIEDEYYPTTEMIRIYVNKPLRGSNIKEYRKIVMSL